MDPVVLIEEIKKQVAISVKESVNGKIDALRKEITEHNLSHDADMQKILPVITAYANAEAMARGAQTSGKAILWFAGAVTALGGAWIVSMQIWHQFFG